MMELEPEIASCGHYIEHDNECHEVGIKEERERIIKLLDKNLGYMDWDELKTLIEKGQ
jgi:hypothetical protein